MLVVSTTVASAAMALPTTEAWGNRCRNFNDDHSANGWNPSFSEVGGIGSYVTDGDVSNDFDMFENYMSLVRTSENGELYWRDYINGTYGIGDGYITLKMYKSEGANAVIYNFGSGGDNFFNLKWADDGKLYAKYRDNASASDDLTNYKYVCDIAGDIAEITIYGYSTSQFYHIAVNGEIVAFLLYSANAASTIFEQLRIELLPGQIGDELQVDYFYTGAITSSPILPVSLSTDMSNIESGTVDVIYNFIGTGTAPDANIYFAAYDSTYKNLLSVDVVPVADNVVYTDTGATVTGTLAVDPENYLSTKVKAFIWDSDIAPLFKPAIVGLSPLPPAFSNIMASDNFDNGIVLNDGGFYVTEVWGSAEATEENNKFNLITDGSICGADVWINNANNYLKFTMSKSSKDAWARFESLVSFEITMLTDGSVIVEDLDAPNGYRTIVPACDNLSYDFAVKFDEATSTLSVWVDNVLVADDIRSNGFGYTLRLSSEMGNPGDTISISNFVAGQY